MNQANNTKMQSGAMVSIGKVAKKVISMREFGLIFALLALIILAWIITPSLFTVSALTMQSRNFSITMILAVGMMAVILTGGIDLSIGSTLALSSIVTSLIISENMKMPIIVLILLSLLVGALCGLVNGFIVGKLKVQPMIATLATMYIYRGLAFLLSDGVWFFPHKYPQNFKDFAGGKFLVFNNIVWIAILIIVLCGLFYSITKPGRRLYAVGSNEDSAKVAGVNSGNVKMLSYIIMGALAGFCGMLYSSNYAIGQSSVANGIELEAIAICVLGGVSITGGRGNMFGLVLGMLMMFIITSFLSLLPNMSIWKNALQGGIIIVAVLINIILAKMAEKRALVARGI